MNLPLARRAILCTGLGTVLCAHSSGAPLVQSPPPHARVATVPATPAVFPPAPAAANLLANGDFENNTAGVLCQSNLTNVQVGAMLPTAVGFGTAQEIDIYPIACYGLPAISGTTKVGVASPGGTQDAFSLQLSHTVFAGDSLDLTYAAQAVTQFNPNLGIIEVGLSTAASSFGTSLFTGPLAAPNVWEWFSASLIAPVDGDYLTIRSIANNGSWVHLDAFSLSVGASTLFCSGDGSGLACPCASGTAVYRGCANSSFAAGAHLHRSGSAGASAATDSLVLKAGEVAGTGLFLQGTGLVPGGGGPFGDGLLCVTGALTRMGIASPTGGLAVLPHAGSPTPLHLVGGVVAGDVRHYQFWYRDAIAFCTPATFNMSQGITVTWGP